MPVPTTNEDDLRTTRVRSGVCETAERTDVAPGSPFAMVLVQVLIGSLAGRPAASHAP